MSLKDYYKVIEAGVGEDASKCRCKAGDKIYTLTKRIASRDQRQLSEALTELKQMLRHQNVVQFKDAFIEGSEVCFVTELCEGGDLGDMIKHIDEGSHFEKERALTVLIDVCLGLLFLHERNLIHSDLEPADIFFTSEGVVKIGILGVQRMSRPGADHDDLYKAELVSVGRCMDEIVQLTAANNNDVEDEELAELKILVDRLQNIGPDTPAITVIDILNAPFIRKRILCTLKDHINDYCKRRTAFVEELREVATTLKKLHRKVSFARVGTAVVGVLGAGAAIGAGIATILTGGVLTPVVIGVVAGSTAAAAGLSSLGAQFVKKFQDKRHLKLTKAKMDECRKEAEDLGALIMSLMCEAVPADTKKMRDIMDLLRPDELHIQYTSKVWESVNTAGVAGRSASAGVTTAKCAVNVASILGSAGKGAARVVATGSIGIVFSVVGLVIDFWQIIDASMDLAKDNPSKASKWVIAVADCIDERSTALRRQINDT